MYLKFEITDYHKYLNKLSKDVTS